MKKIKPVLLEKPLPIADVLPHFPKKFRRDRINGKSYVVGKPCHDVEVEFVSTASGKIMRRVLSDRIGYVVPYNGRVIIPVSAADAWSHGLFVHSTVRHAEEYAYTRLHSGRGITTIGAAAGRELDKLAV